MNTNDSVMEDYILDQGSEEDIWWSTESQEEAQWEAGSDSDSSIRSVVTDSDDDDDIGSIPSLISPLPSTPSHSSEEILASNDERKSSASSVHTGDSAYESPIHHFETDTNIPTTYYDANKLSHLYSKSEEYVIKADPSRQCHVCDTTFFDAEKYEVHVRTHERLKKMMCPFCTVMHVNGEDFFRHLKTHESAGLQCKVCMKRFKYQESLKEHKKFHSTWRKCPFYSCKKLFRTDKLYKQHLKSHNIYGEDVADRQNLKRKLVSSCSSNSDEGIWENFLSYQSDSEEEQSTSEEDNEDDNEIIEPGSGRVSPVGQPLNKKFHIDKSKKLSIKKTIKESVNRHCDEYRKAIKPLI